jgi:thiol-disulfide isomerase/thioredoxin
MISRRTAIVGIVLVATIAVAGAAAVRYQRSTNTVAMPASAEKVTLQFFKDPVAVTTFTARTIDGRTLSSGDWRGTITLVNFWATWCPPCKAEIPDLIALQEKYRDHLQIIGVSEDEGSPEVVAAFAAEHKINYPVVMSTPELREAFPGVSGLPTSFVIDRQGRIVQRHVGILDATTTEHEARALAGLPVDAMIELIDPSQPVGLANAAHAKEIPGIDLSRLSPEKRMATLLRLNAEPCTCGCGLTVAKCRIDDPQCGVSLPLARHIADEIAKKP